MEYLFKTASDGGALSNPREFHYNASMPAFRIHRLKENPRQQFRWAPHVSGIANAKPKDYELSGQVEAENEYAVWARLRGTEAPLMPGDILESVPGQLRICKYVGFEDARWIVPEIPQSQIGAAQISAGDSGQVQA